MKISVVMATYNGEQYIEEQLESIRNQTWNVDEVVICDDCSRDDTVRIVKAYIQKYALEEHWHIYVNEQNMGYAGNFNHAAMMATGDYIFFADQDDIWNLRKVEIMTDIMEHTPECMVLSSDYEVFGAKMDTDRTPREILKGMPNDNSVEKVVLSARSIYIGALGCCMCVRREFYQDIESYWFEGWAQDDRMWRLSQCADGCYLLHANLVKHRIHSNNTSTFGKYHTVEKRVQLFESMRNAEKEMLRMLQDRGDRTKSIAVVRKHLMMMEYRIELMKDRKYILCLKLFTYLRYYQRVKSYFVDIYVTMRS